MGFPATCLAAGLAATLAAGLVARLAKDLAQGSAALEAGLAAVLVGGSRTCGKQSGSNIAHEVQFLAGKGIGEPPCSTAALYPIAKN